MCDIRCLFIYSLCLKSDTGNGTQSAATFLKVQTILLLFASLRAMHYCGNLCKINFWVIYQVWSRQLNWCSLLIAFATALGRFNWTRIRLEKSILCSSHFEFIFNCNKRLKFTSCDAIVLWLSNWWILIALNQWSKFNWIQT